jgi:hypothetical protein
MYPASERALWRFGGGMQASDAISASASASAITVASARTGFVEVSDIEASSGSCTPASFPPAAASREESPVLPSHADRATQIGVAKARQAAR